MYAQEMYTLYQDSETAGQGYESQPRTFPETRELIDTSYRDFEARRPCDWCKQAFAIYLPNVNVTEDSLEYPLLGLKWSQVEFHVGHFKLRAWTCEGGDSGCGRQYSSYHIYANGVDGIHLESAANSCFDGSNLDDSSGTSANLSTADQLPYSSISGSPTPYIPQNHLYEQEPTSLPMRSIPRKQLPTHQNIYDYEHQPPSRAAWPLGGCSSAESTPFERPDISLNDHIYENCVKSSGKQTLQVPSHPVRRHSDAQAYPPTLAPASKPLRETSLKGRGERRRNMDHDRYRRIRQLGACDVCRQKKSACDPLHHRTVPEDNNIFP